MLTHYWIDRSYWPARVRARTRPDFRSRKSVAVVKTDSSPARRTSGNGQTLARVSGAVAEQVPSDAVLAALRGGQGNPIFARLDYAVPGLSGFGDAAMVDERSRIAWSLQKDAFRWFVSVRNVAGQASWDAEMFQVAVAFPGLEERSHVVPGSAFFVSASPADSLEWFTAGRSTHEKTRAEVLVVLREYESARQALYGQLTFAVSQACRDRDPEEMAGFVCKGGEFVPVKTGEYQPRVGGADKADSFHTRLKGGG